MDSKTLRTLKFWAVALAFIAIILLMHYGIMYGWLPGPHKIPFSSGSIEHKPEIQAEIWAWQANTAPPNVVWWYPTDLKADKDGFILKDGVKEWMFVPAPHDDRFDDWAMKPPGLVSGVTKDADYEAYEYFRDRAYRDFTGYPTLDRALTLVWDNCGKLLIAAIAFTILFCILGYNSETDYTHIRHCPKCGYVGHAKLCPSLACEDVATICPGFTNDRPFVGGMYQGGEE